MFDDPPVEKKGESIHGYIQRTAHFYYYPNATAFFTSNRLYTENLNYSTGSGITKEMVELSRKLSLKTDDLILNKFNDVLFINEPNRKKQSEYYNHKKVEYCPICMKEDYYHRLLWDVSYATVCLEHEVYLVGECANCFSEIHMMNFMQGYCKCGNNYLDNDILIQPHSFVLSAQKTIQDLLTGEINEVKRLEDGQIISGQEYFQLFDLMITLMDNFHGDLFDLLDIGMDESKINSNDLMNKTFKSTYAHLLITEPYKYFPSFIKRLDI